MGVRSPVTVTTSLEPATIGMTGCKVIVTATPVSDRKYFDKVICGRFSIRPTRHQYYKSKKLTRGLLKPKLCTKSSGNLIPLRKYRGKEFPNTTKETEDVATEAEGALTSFEILHVTASISMP